MSLSEKDYMKTARSTFAVVILFSTLLVYAGVSEPGQFMGHHISLQFARRIEHTILLLLWNTNK